MPVQYTTIVDEHKAVRERVGLFDISHMGRLTFDGPGVLDWLERVTTNHVAKLADLQIQYSLMATDSGGVIDDILVYRQPFAYLVVCNASNRGPVNEPGSSDIASGRRGQFRGSDPRHRDDRRSGPEGPRDAPASLRPAARARSVLSSHDGPAPGRLERGDQPDRIHGRGWVRGDRGGQGAPSTSGTHCWNRESRMGSRPCGLGARDTLRLEAAMPLYGHELSESINPYAAGVGWAVKLDKGDFAGKSALTA